ncbi:hypothetical protein IE994_24560 [Enterobacter hormaechei]|nr:hypothetical protein [Enterobacter hormaechei]
MQAAKPHPAFAVGEKLARVGSSILRPQPRKLRDAQGQRPPGSTGNPAAAHRAAPRSPAASPAYPAER